jgi:hypothetical protein
MNIIGLYETGRNSISSAMEQSLATVSHLVNFTLLAVLVSFGHIIGMIEGDGE